MRFTYLLKWWRPGENNNNHTVIPDQRVKCAALLFDSCFSGAKHQLMSNVKINLFLLIITTLRLSGNKQFRVHSPKTKQVSLNVSAFTKQPFSSIEFLFSRLRPEWMIVLLNWSSGKIEEMVSVDSIIVRTAAVVMMHAIKLNTVILRYRELLFVHLFLCVA